MQLFMLSREQATLRGFEREIEDYPHEFPSPLMHGAVLACAYAHLGRADEAETIMRELTRRDLSDWYVDEEWLFSVCLLAETCGLLDDVDAAGPLYELLVPYGSQNATAVPELALDSVSRPLGILATLLGRFEDAVRHLQEALRMNERMGARPFLARTHEAHARMLLRRNAPRDRAHAEALLSIAQATYRELGMQHAADTAAALESGRPAAAGS
jgi:tetratricopeptide (TPR) repeat protein